MLFKILVKQRLESRAKFFGIEVHD
jgi:hypothetical protein